MNWAHAQIPSGPFPKVSIVEQQLEDQFHVLSRAVSIAARNGTISCTP